MRIEVLSRTHQAGIDNTATVTQRSRHLLDHLDERIERLDVQLIDLNGPKGGVDRECQVRAKLADGGVLVTRARAEMIPKAVDAAIRKLVRRVTDLYDRAIDRRRRGVRLTALPG